MYRVTLEGFAIFEGNAIPAFIYCATVTPVPETTDCRQQPDESGRTTSRRAGAVNRDKGGERPD
jgi:hypothetical protein